MALWAADRNEDIAHSDAMQKRSRKRQRPQFLAREPAQGRVFNGAVFRELYSFRRH